MVIKQIIKKSPQLIILLLMGIFIIVSCKKEKAGEDLPALEKCINIQWVKKYAFFAGWDIERSLYRQNLIVGTDGSITMLLSIINQTSSQDSIVLLKTDSEGNTIFLKEFPVTLEPEVYVSDISIISTSDNGYLISYFTKKYAIGKYTELIKTDGSGNLIWEKKYDFWGTTYLCSILENSSNSYYAFGISDSLKNFMLNISGNGDTIRSKKLNTVYINYTASLNSDSHIILAGTYDMETVPPLYDFTWQGHVMCIDTNANEIWSAQDIILNTEPVFITKQIRNNDNSIVVTGGYGGYGVFMDPFNTGSIIACFSTEGNLLWNNFIGDLPYGSYDITKMTNYGYVLVSNSQKQIIIVDGIGNFNKAESLDIFPRIKSYSIESSGNDYVLFGLIYSEDYGSLSPFLIKFNFK
jgi:hypothetical protein